MPTIIMTSAWPKRLDGSVKAKAMTFLQKLQQDDTTPGLHIEPLTRSADPRVRTGRVDQFWRAVMFRLDAGGEAHYVIHGVWPHDDAVTVAQRVRLTVNPINGLPQIDEVPLPANGTVAATPGTARPAAERVDEPAEAVRAEPTPPTPAVPAAEPAQPHLVRAGYSRADLVDTLGVPKDVAQAALTAPDDNAVLALADQHAGWLQLILLGLAAGDPVPSIVESLELERAASTDDGDADLLRSLQRPAAKAQFAVVGNQDELRRAIEAGDFGAWRVFLHPEQRRFVDNAMSGPARISGGAGTGKTVVLIHRARALARRYPGSRIVLTTFTTNLADALRDGLVQLDVATPVAGGLDRPGVHVTGVDALASAVLRRASPADLATATTAVLGEERAATAQRTPSSRWRQALDDASSGLPPELANETFVAGEYTLVVLPNRVRTLEEYLRVRRPGRGVALDRGKRTQVWRLVEAYRAQARVDGSLDFPEAAAVAAAYLEGAGGGGPRHLADHVLVDEGQDLHPSHWQLLRALVPPGRNDLFLAEDSHQRIYGARVVLGRYGIKIVGRSHRLRLNYRTTAQNLRYAMSVLEGGAYRDLEDEPEATGYRSVRTGPDPVVERAPSLLDELGMVVEQVRAWMDDGVAAGTIAVLVPDRYQRDRVVAALGEAGIRSAGVDRERPPTDRVPVLTMHRAKGTEFSRVVLTDVGWSSSLERERLKEMDESERADAELRQRSLVYVASTRARDELVVIER